MYATTEPMVDKISWFTAARYFFSNKSEVGMFVKAMSFMGVITLPATVVDDTLDAVPILDILTIGDDVLVAFGVFALFRITMIRRKVNQQREEFSR